MQRFEPGFAVEQQGADSRLLESGERKLEEANFLIKEIEITLQVK